MILVYNNGIKTKEVKKMKRTSIMYKGKVWEVNSQLKCNEANMERYRVIYGRTSMICKIDIYSGQVIKEVA